MRMLHPIEVAERIHVHPKTAAVWMRNGYLPAQNLAPRARRACWRISEADLEKWMKSRPRHMRPPGGG